MTSAFGAEFVGSIPTLGTMNRSLFDSIELDGEVYEPLVICCRERIEKTVEFLKKQGHKNLIWIPMNEREIDGYICEGDNAEQ